VTTARSIIRGALSFHLNRLSPGESEDADTFNTCLDALNFIADEWNGSKSFLFKTVRTAGTVTGASGTLGSTWALSPGVQILGASYNDGSIDVDMAELTIAQYQSIPTKTTSGEPHYWAYDGLATVYVYQVPTSRSVTLRTKGEVSDFADLDTDYSMPKGYKSALAACLAEKVAPVMLGLIPASVATAARLGRSQVHAQAFNPAILNADTTSHYDINRGW
jgi:hypothetical protein